MFLSRSPDAGHILITTSAPLRASVLIRVRRGEVREWSLLEGFFYLYLRYLQSGDCPVYLFASLWTLRIIGR